MRVVTLSPEFYPYGSGAEVTTKIYVEKWAEMGHEVVVLTNSTTSPSIQTNKRYHFERLGLYERPLGADYILFIKTVLNNHRLRRVLHGADIVYDPSNNWWLAEIISKYEGVPVVRHLHSYSISCPLSSLYNNTENRTCNGPGSFKCPRCIAIHSRENRFRQIHQIAHITLGPVFSRFGSIFAQRIPARFVYVSRRQQELIERSAPITKRRGCVVYPPPPELTLTPAEAQGLAYLGGDVKEKGFYVLLDALSTFRPSFPILMTKVRHDMIPYLRSLGIEAYGVLERSRFQEIMSRIHCIVYPSIWEETYFGAVMEGMMRGKLIIASRTGSLMEVLGEQPGIIYVDPGSASQLSHALRIASEIQLSEANELGKRNRDALLRFYDRYDSSLEMMKIFEAVRKDSV